MATIKEMLRILKEGNCTESFKHLKKFKEILESETCEVCVEGENKGCAKCKIGEFLGETPY